MTEIVDATITELRAIHDRLRDRVATLSDEQLTAPSGATEWTVADVLSHLGSGAEIGRYPLVAAAGQSEDAPANQEVWDRWNALPPREQAAGFVESEERLVSAYEALSEEQRASVEIELGFLPQPVPLATSLGMRVNEMALHGWDVEVALDTGAALSDESARLILRHFAETMAFVLGFSAKPDGAPSARVALGDHTLVVEPEGVRVEAGRENLTATFEGPVEAGVRLLAGRLKPEHTPAGVTVTGNITLDELRAVFPGY